MGVGRGDEEAQGVRKPGPSDGGLATSIGYVPTMTKKALTRAEIAEMLRPRPGQSADELATVTLDALQAALEGIAAGSIPGGYTIDRRRRRSVICWPAARSRPRAQRGRSSRPTPYPQHRDRPRPMSFSAVLLGCVDEP